LTRGYAARLVKEGITVNAVAPSLIETDMMKGQENLSSRIPLGRFGRADEVAKVVMLLVDNPYMTGQTVAMSGGMTFNWEFAIGGYGTRRFESPTHVASADEMAIARGRRWLDEVVSGRVTTVAELCTREKCSARQVNMTISLAFLAPNLVKAAVEGRLPRGIGVERLRDPPTEWSRQFKALGLNPE
jgi:hypothetical protein